MSLQNSLYVVPIEFRFSIFIKINANIRRPFRQASPVHTLRYLYYQQYTLWGVRFQSFLPNGVHEVIVEYRVSIMYKYVNIE